VDSSYGPTCICCSGCHSSRSPPGGSARTSSPPRPRPAYGIVLLAASLACFTLQAAIIHTQGDASKLALAIGRDLKGKVSPLLCAIGIGLAFVDRWLSVAIYVAVALMWLIPDRRVERTFTTAGRSPDAPPES
jgi:uncharacterized membrane protein